MGNKIRTRITISLATTFAALSLLPLEAMAEPQGVWLPAKCGANASVDLVQVARNSLSIFDENIIQIARLPAIAQDIERRAGAEVLVKGLTKPNRTEGGSGGFELAQIDFRVPTNFPDNKITPDDLVANFHFKNQGVASKTFRQLGITTLKPGTWQQVNAKQPSVGIGNNDLCLRVVIFVRNTVKNRAVAVDFGGVNVVHKNETGLSDGTIDRREGDCDDLDL